MIPKNEMKIFDKFGIILAANNRNIKEYEYVKYLGKSIVGRNPNKCKNKGRIIKVVVIIRSTLFKYFLNIINPKIKGYV